MSAYYGFVGAAELCASLMNAASAAVPKEMVRKWDIDKKSLAVYTIFNYMAKTLDHTAEMRTGNLVIVGSVLAGLLGALDFVADSHSFLTPDVDVAIVAGSLSVFAAAFEYLNAAAKRCPTSHD